MYTGIRLLMLIHLFVSCFFFLSNYQTLKIFVTLFSGVVRLTELKLGTHVNIVYTRIRLLVHICPFLSSFFYIFKSQTLNVFVTLLLGTMRPTKMKLGLYMESGLMYHVYKDQAAGAYLSL